MKITDIFWPITMKRSTHKSIYTKPFISIIPQRIGDYSLEYITMTDTSYVLFVLIRLKNSVVVL